MSKPNYERWDEILAMLKSGALGDLSSPTTLLKYWQMLESAGYPSANENVKYFEALIEKEGHKTSRYIDADELLNRIPDDLPYKASVKRVLTQAPTADVVEVVRCKDCAHYIDIDGFVYDGKARHCAWHSALRYDNDYCSDGARIKEIAK